MTTLLQPTIEAIDWLHATGLRVATPVGVKVFRGRLLFGVFDMVARAPVLNMVQFNGANGCHVCTHPGKQLGRGKRIYPPNPTPHPVQRTHQMMIQDATRAVETGSAFNGVKGPSVVAPCFDLVRSIPIDYMHAVLEGVTKSLLRSWFDKKNHRHPFYIGRYLKEVDSILIQQRPPHEFSRPPRAIQTHLSYWKAQEFKAWLLFYSLPILADYLPALYFHHFTLLVCSMHLLLRESITTVQIDAAEEMIRHFYTLSEELYGEGFCRPNLHALSHLCQYVRWWGPLWTHSTFGFESLNGHLHRLFHGRGQVVDQMALSIDVELMQRELRPKIMKECHAMSQFFSSLRSTTMPMCRPNMTLICNAHSTYAVGSTQPMPLTMEEKQVLAPELHVPTDLVPDSTKSFSRIYHLGTLYHSTSYERGKGKRNSCVCCFLTADGLKHFGSIKRFVQIGSHSLALIEAFVPEDTSLLDTVGPPCRTILEDYAALNFVNIFFIKVAKYDRQLLAVPIFQIRGKCVFVDSPSFTCSYVITQPNKYDHN